MSLVQLILLSAVVCGAIFVLRILFRGAGQGSRREPMFAVRFDEGEAAEVSGCLPESLRRDLLRVARDFRVSGRVAYHEDEGLETGGDLDDGELQRFRNVIAMHMRRPEPSS